MGGEGGEGLRAGFFGAAFFGAAFFTDFFGAAFFADFFGAAFLGAAFLAAFFLVAIPIASSMYWCDLQNSECYQSNRKRSKYQSSSRTQAEKISTEASSLRRIRVPAEARNHRGEPRRIEMDERQTPPVRSNASRRIARQRPERIGTGVACFGLRRSYFTSICKGLHPTAAAAQA